MRRPPTTALTLVFFVHALVACAGDESESTVQPEDVEVSDSNEESDMFAASPDSAGADTFVPVDIDVDGALLDALEPDAAPPDVTVDVGIDIAVEDSAMPDVAPPTPDVSPPAGWSTAAPLPISVTENVAATVAGKIYVMGGFVGFQSPADVHRYDPATDAWTAAAPLPSEGFHHLSVVSAAGKLWFVAGLETIGFTPTKTTLSYDPNTDQWTQMADALLPRGAAGAAEIDGTIYVAAGLTPTGASNTLMSYSIAEDSWAELAPMDVVREHVGACALNGKLHLFGGRLGGLTNFDTHRVYDPSTDEWSAADPLPTARSGIGVVTFNDRCHVFGGEESDGTFGEHEVWSDTDGWTTLTPLPTPRHGLGATVLNGSIFLIGGGPQPGFTFSNVSEVWSP